MPATHRPAGPEESVAAVQGHDRARLRRPDEVHAPIAVQIARRGGEDHAGRRKAGVARREATAPQVVVEREPALRPRQQQVHVPVAVEVRGNGEPRDGAGRDARGRRDVGPRSVEIVAQQAVARFRRHVEVEVAVGIHVERNDAIPRGHRDATVAVAVPDPERPWSDEVERARVGDVGHGEVFRGGTRNGGSHPVTRRRRRGNAQPLRPRHDEIPGILSPDAHGGGAREGLQARIRLSHICDRDRKRRAGAQRGGERGAPVLDRQAHDADIDVVARSLVARRRAQDVLGDLVPERSGAGVSGPERQPALRQRLVELRFAGDEGREPIRRRDRPGRVPVGAIRLGNTDEQEHVRGRLDERGLQVPDRAAAGGLSHLRLEPGRVPERCDVPRREGCSLLVALDRSRPVAGELTPRALERQDTRVAGRELERLGQQPRRLGVVLRAHRGDGAVGPAERLGGRELPDGLELRRGLREVALLERREADVPGCLELQCVGRRRRGRRNRHREQQAEDGGQCIAAGPSASPLTPFRGRGLSRRPRGSRRRARRTRSSGRIRSWARRTAPRRR